MSALPSSGREDPDAKAGAADRAVMGGTLAGLRCAISSLPRRVTAKMLGFPVPLSPPGRADEVIE
jgi:hypothetical protein